MCPGLEPRSSLFGKQGGMNTISKSSAPPTSAPRIRGGYEIPSKPAARPASGPIMQGSNPNGNTGRKQKVFA